MKDCACSRLFMFFVEKLYKRLCVFNVLGFQSNPPEINKNILISGGLA